LATLSEINKTNEVHLEAGGEKFVYFDNLIMDFKNQNAISVFWSIYAESNLEHFIFIDLQTEDNATSPSILHHHTNLTFHQNGEVTEEG